MGFIRARLPGCERPRGLEGSSFSRDLRKVESTGCVDSPHSRSGLISRHRRQLPVPIHLGIATKSHTRLDHWSLDDEDCRLTLRSISVSPINHANVEQDPKELEKLGKIEVILRTVVSLGDPGVELDEQDAGGFDGSPAIMIYTTNVRPISEYTRYEQHCRFSSARTHDFYRFPTPERLGPGRAIDRHLGDVKTEMDASLSFRFEYCDRCKSFVASRGLINLML